MGNTMLSLLSKEMLDEYGRAGFWQDETIYAVAMRHARATPDAPAVRDRNRRLTYRELIASADALAADMASRGVRFGQRVAVWLSSRTETAIALLACSRNSYVCCPSLHRDHTVREVAELCARMRASVLIAQPGYGADGDRADIFRAVEGFSCIRHVYRLDAGTGFTGLIDPAGTTAMDGAPAGDPNRIIYLPFTSGTTGAPKGVMHSDNTLLANARALSTDWRFASDSVVYTLSPLSHNLGLGALIAAIVVGGELVVHDVPRGHSLLDRLVETGTTFLFGVPTHAIDLLTELHARSAERLGKVTGFRISGAAATPDVIRALMRYGVTPQSGYGMTETCSHQYTLPDDDPEIIASTSGRACPGYEVRIWRQDDPDREAETGEVGQIGGRGASLMLGYFDDQDTTESSFNAHGWFMTGDLGWMDADGYLRIVGRKKDLIIRGGHNIYPARIEELAMRHPAVEKAAAFPVPDERLGEKLCLALLLRRGSEIDDEELFAHLDAAGLSRFDMPEYLVHADTLPMTASGKIVKRTLSDQVRDGVLQPRPVRFQPKAVAHD
jgi:acyl-CoA synthetase (AMP-forming)/AMP-acid ligase II